MRCVLQPPARSMMQRACTPDPNLPCTSTQAPATAEGSSSHWTGAGRGAGVLGTPGRGVAAKNHIKDKQQEIGHPWAEAPSPWNTPHCPISPLTKHKFTIKWLRNLRWQPRNIDPQSGNLLSIRHSVTGHSSMNQAPLWTLTSVYCLHQLGMWEHPRIMQNMTGERICHR